MKDRRPQRNLRICSTCDKFFHKGACKLECRVDYFSPIEEVLWEQMWIPENCVMRLEMEVLQQ